MGYLMNENNGEIKGICSRWVRVCVDTFDHGILDTGPYDRRSAWLWLIANAAWKAKRINHKGRPLDLQRGQVLAGRKFLSQKWGWTEKQVRNFLVLLGTERMIEVVQSKGHLANVITICNYEIYQNAEKGEGQAKGQCRASAGPVQGHTLTIDTNTTNNNSSQHLDAAREAAPLPGQDELKELSRQMFAAAGNAMASEAIAPGLASMMVPQMWLDQGCDLRLDVLPAVRHVASKIRQKIRSWDYFTAAVHEARDKRIAGKPMRSAKVIAMVRDLTPEELEIAREQSRAAIRAAQARMSQCDQSQKLHTTTASNSRATETADSTRHARSVHPFDLPQESAASAFPC